MPQGATINTLVSQDRILVVDLDDAEFVVNTCWSVNTDGYAVRGTWNSKTRKGSTVYLHRILLGLKTGDGKVVDHANRDRLDCRRSNLRVTDRSGNSCNTKPIRINNTSGYRGVSLVNSPTRPWHARIVLRGKVVLLGRFETAELAARAYDAKAKELHGEFASLNFPKN